MLIIDEEQFLREISSQKSISMQMNNPLINPKSIDLESIKINSVKMENSTFDNFRKPANQPNIPNEIKPIIGALATLDSNKNVAEAFGISKDTVGNLANDNHKNGEVVERRINIVESVKTKTVSKIEECLEFLTIAKEMPRKELLATAESLSRIHKNVSPNSEPLGNNLTQFIYYVPESQAKISDYEVIEVDR